MKAKFVLLTLLFSASALAANISPNDLWITKKNDSTPMQLMQGKLNLISVKMNEHDKQLNYVIEARYPKISGTKLSPGAEHFNEHVKKMLDKLIADFKSDLKNNKAPIAAESYLKINYESVGFVSQSQHSDYISVRFDINRYEKGMAHPANEVRVFNFDLAQNKELKLADIFQPNSAYLENISNYCKKELSKQKSADASMIESGASSKEENYRNWNLTLSGLLITFDEAQVAPRYMGKQEVLIPKDQLTKTLTHEAACTLGVINCDIT